MANFKKRYETLQLIHGNINMHVFDCKFLLIELMANNISYQIVMPNKNSKLSISYVSKQSASPFVLGSSLVFANYNKASFISKA